MSASGCSFINTPCSHCSFWATMAVLSSHDRDVEPAKLEIFSIWIL